MMIVGIGGLISCMLSSSAGGGYLYYTNTYPFSNTTAATTGTGSTADGTGSTTTGTGSTTTGTGSTADGTGSTTTGTGSTAAGTGSTAAGTGSTVPSGISVGGTSIGAPLAPPTYVTNGLVAYWDLSTSTANNGDVLTSIPDLAGGNYNLMYTSGTPSLQFNTSPKRIVFPSSSAYYDVPYTLSYTNGVTFEMDCIIRANDAGYTPVSLFWQNSTTPQSRLHLTYLSTTSTWGSAGWSVTTRSSASISPTVSIEDNTTPYHIVLTVNPSGLFTLYVNGTNIGTTTLPVYDGPGVLRIGTYAPPNAYNQVGAFLMGRVYNRVLSQTEVTTNYNIAISNRR